LVGQVRDIRWRSTLIEARNWETIVIPNSAIMKGRVAILGRREGRPLQWRRSLRFMVDPSVPPARVIAIVNEEMIDVPIANVAQTPAPSTVLHGFVAGNLEYELRYFLTDLLEDEMTDSMVRVHLFASLQRAGIRIAEEQRTLRAGQFFGEMSLLTGDARSATVVAKTDVECYRLDGKSFQGLLLGRPEIAEGIARVIASRRPELEKVREVFATQPMPVQNEQADLLSRIRRFFGLRAKA